MNGRTDASRILRSCLCVVLIIQFSYTPIRPQCTHDALPMLSACTYPDLRLRNPGNRRQNRRIGFAAYCPDGNLVADFIPIKGLNPVPGLQQGSSFFSLIIFCFADCGNKFILAGSGINININRYEKINTVAILIHHLPGPGSGCAEIPGPSKKYHGTGYGSPFAVNRL